MTTVLPGKSEGDGPVVSQGDVRTTWDAVGDPARLAALAATALPGGGPVPALDALTSLAARLLDARVALVSLVEADRQCFVSQVGLSGPLAADPQTPLSHSYCRHVVETAATLVAPDVREHPLLRDNPAIDDYQAIAYLGAPVRTPDGLVLGSLCAIEDRVRQWSDTDVGILEDLAAAASSEIAARLAAHDATVAASRLHRILDTTQDAFITLDAAGQVTAWNLAAEELFGWSQAEVLGRPLSELIIPVRYRAAHERGLSRVAGTGVSAVGGRPVEMTAVHRGGREFPVEIAVTLMHEAAGVTFHAFVRDISARKWSESLRDMEYAVASALATAPSAEQAAGAVVRSVAEALRWPYVEYWHRSADEQKLTLLTYRSCDDDETAGMRGRTSFPAGDGLPGVVWATGTAQWVADFSDSSFPRADAARAAGLRTTAAVPVRNGSDVLGTLLAYSRRVEQPDAELMASLETISAHIGQFMHRRRAEELELELARAREDFDRVVSNVSDHLWTVEVLDEGHTRSVYSSPSGHAVFGGPLPTDADLAQLLVAAAHPDDHALVADFLSAVAAGAPVEAEYRIIGMDGVVRSVWTRATSRWVEQRMYVDGVCTDVTERHRAQTELRQQADLLELAPTAILVRELDSRITFWNGGAAATYGWDAGEALGRVTHRLLDPVFPASREAVDEALRTAGRWDGELTHRRADGTRITVLSRQAMQYGADGQPVAILEINTDVSARKRAERELAEKEQRFRTQFSMATVGQAMLDLRGTFVQVNPALAAMLGYAVDELVGRTVDQITPTQDRRDTRTTAASLLAEPTPVDRQQRLVRADGGIVVTQVGMSLVRDADGRPRNFIAVVQDITSRVAAERERDSAAAELEQRNRELQASNAQLAAANMLKLDLMGMLSHDIGTPLTLIAGYAELLLDEPETLTPAQRSRLDSIVRAVQRLETLRRETLTMCTLDAGRLQASPEPVALAAAISEALAGLEATVPVSCPSDLRVLIHPAHLQQILTNLVGNAAKYAGTATAVAVDVHPGHVEIHLHDEGSGVPEELRPQLFERYTRAASTASSTAGHGLGLYIVKALAEANGGTISYAPRSPRGSTFTVRLPAA